MNCSFNAFRSYRSAERHCPDSLDQCADLAAIQPQNHSCKPPEVSSSLMRLLSSWPPLVLFWLKHPIIHLMSPWPSHVTRMSGYVSVPRSLIPVLVITTWPTWNPTDLQNICLLDRDESWMYCCRTLTHSNLLEKAATKSSSWGRPLKLSVSTNRRWRFIHGICSQHETSDADKTTTFVSSCTKEKLKTRWE